MPGTNQPERPTPLRPRGASWYRVERAAAADAAEVYVYDEIGRWGVTAQDFVATLNEVTAPVINLHLNTPGGDVFDGVAIYNALKNHPATVKVWIEALAASIGTVIAAAGDEVVIAPHAKMMIHDAAGFMDIFGFYNPRDLEQVMERISAMGQRLEETSNNIASIYAERSETDATTWRAAMQAETWYTDEEAVTAGLADRVGRSNDEQADRLAARMVARLDVSRYRHGREVAVLQEEFVDDELEQPEEPADLTPEAEPAESGEPTTQEDHEEASHRARRRGQVDRVLEELGV